MQISWSLWMVLFVFTWNINTSQSGSPKIPVAHTSFDVTVDIKKASTHYHYLVELIDATWKRGDCNVRCGWCQDGFSANHTTCHFRLCRLRLSKQRRLKTEYNCILTSVVPFCIVFCRFGTLTVFISTCCLPLGGNGAFSMSDLAPEPAENTRSPGLHIVTWGKNYFMRLIVSWYWQRLS